jgi:quercetin dioxygenase-like cupin family protein
LSSATSEPIVVGPITVTFTVEAEQSGGSVTVSRCDVPQGAGMPVAHSHDAFEETLYGVTGITTLVVDGERIELTAGDTFCIPRGAVHTFSADAGDAAFLAICTPGLFGPDYFLELAAVIDDAHGGPPDPEAITTVMLRHGLTPAPSAAAASGTG